MTDDKKNIKVYAEDHYELLLIKARLSKKTGENQSMADIVKQVVEYFTRDQCN